jgi:AcrR family transcriptional regulator
MRKARRARVVREDIRERLLDAALVEFGAKGFDGASTRAIAQRVGAHQPQINYHFESKEELWAAAVDRLFAELLRTLRGVVVERVRGDEVSEIAADFAEGIRRFVHFSARHPELNQIMVHEATAQSSRLTWMTERHVKPLYRSVRASWRRLREAGVAAPIDERLLHYVMVGAASLVYVNASEARLLMGVEPTATRWVETHAEGLVAMLLPNTHRVRRRPARRKRPALTPPSRDDVTRRPRRLRLRAS